MAKKRNIGKNVFKSEDLQELTQLVPVNSVKPWKDNVNIHTKESIDKIKKSLELYGQMTPIVVWSGDNQIRKGNGTYLAAKELGWKNIYATFIDFQNAVVADMYGTTDNKTSELSYLDEEKLLQLFLRDDVESYTFGDRKKLAEYSSFTEDELRGIFLEADVTKLEKVESKNTGDVSVIQVFCSKEYINDVRDYLDKLCRIKFKNIEIEVR